MILHVAKSLSPGAINWMLEFDSSNNLYIIILSSQSKSSKSLLRMNFLNDIAHLYVTNCKQRRLRAWGIKHEHHFEEN